MGKNCHCNPRSLPSCAPQLTAALGASVDYSHNMDAASHCILPMAHLFQAQPQEKKTCPEAMKSPAATTFHYAFDHDGRRRLRVLHFGRFYDSPSHGGGIQRHVATLLAGLAREIEVTNLVAAVGPRKDCLEDKGFRIYRAPSYGKIAGTAVAPALVTMARRLHQQNPFDIIHLHFPDPLAHLAAIFFPPETRRVITWHSDVIRQRWLFRLYRPWLNHFLAQADAVIASAPANFSASRQLAAVPPERRYVIPFGLDYHFLDTPCVRAKALSVRRRVQHGRSIVLAVGRHVYYKGFDYLLEAISRLPSSHLVLVGKGPLTAKLKAKAAALGLHERITFTGPLADEELAAWYHACDVFCLPSISPAETLGLVQLEAMACAKPVVSTRLGTGVEFINLDGVTGITVPPADAQALAAAIGSIIANPALAARLGKNAYFRARHVFSTETMISRTLALYQTLLKRK